MNIRFLALSLFIVLFIGCQNTSVIHEKETDIKRLEYTVIYKSDSLKDHLDSYKKSIDQLIEKHKDSKNKILQGKLNYFNSKYYYWKEQDSISDLFMRKSISSLSNDENHNYLMLIDGLSQQGRFEFNSGNYNTAKQYYKQAVYYSEKYFDRDSLTPKFAIAAFEGFGCVNRVLNKFELAQNYLEKTTDLAKKQKDTIRLITAISNLSLVYTDTGNLRIALAHIQKAETLALASNSEDLPMVYNYYASIYYEMKEWQQALFYLEKEFELDPEVSRIDKAINLSLIYLELQETDFAKPYIEFLEKEYVANHLNEYERVQTLERLVKYYTVKKDYSKIATYFTKYGQEQQDFYTKEQLAITEDFTKKYDLKAKEDQIKQLGQKNKIDENKLYQRNTTLLIIALTLFLFGSIAVLLYFQQRNKKLKLEKQLLIMEDTLLRSQMEPHFVFNALSSLQSLIYENKNQMAVKYLSKFAQLLRLGLEHSRMKFVPFKKEMDSIENYLELQKMRFGTSFSYHIELDFKDFDACEIPPLMIQPFVENAIYHGFTGIAYTGELKIKCEKYPEYICFTIQDNGIGLEKSKNNANKTKTSLSTAMTVERLRSLYQVKNKIDFLEIKNNTNKKSGTTVILKLPFITT